MLRRDINILLSNSFLLLGPRGTGKTHLIKELLPENRTLFIDLLEPDQFDRYALNTSLLSRELDALDSNIQWVAIDEVQKLPSLLDVAHKYIEKKKIKFALTGSSARKLKRGGANLLAGRAFTYQLYPLTVNELQGEFDLNKALTWGTLPKAYLSSEDQERSLFLRTYVRTYLQEEIVAEQLIRNIDPFRRFLPIAAQMNGEIVNFSKIAQEVGCSDVTVRSYFSILEDTLVGFFLEPYHRSVRKRQRESPKFFLFDTGVQRALANLLTQPLIESTYGFGKTFEHFIILELHRQSDYLQNDFKFSYLRTRDGVEIDLIIERPGKPLALVEIKSTESVRSEHISNLNNFESDFKKADKFCLSRDSKSQKIGSIRCLPWQSGISAIMGLL